MTKIKLLTDFFKEKKTISISLGEFTFNKQIGLSANGYVGEFTFNDKSFAIKFLITESTGVSELVKRKRFIAEYLNVAGLPTTRLIVKNIGFDVISIPSGNETIEIPLIIMKLYNGTLKEYREKDNSRDRFLELYEFLLQTLKFIHRNGIVHRDLKPENIFIENDKLVLGDFGIAFYEPDKFVLNGITEKKERLGNRLFSAPEQEQASPEPHATMDIYAMGQVLQWFATSETLKGTGRKPIRSVYKNMNVYDDIVEKCLSQNPKDRFQNIEEIENYYDKYVEQEDEKDPFSILAKYNEILRKTFPKKISDPIIVDDKTRIHLFFNNLKKEEATFGDLIWYTKGFPNMYFTLHQLQNGNWCVNNDEYDIDKLFITYDETSLNDFVVVRYKSMEPFEIDGIKTYYAGLLDESILISSNEYDNGYAEIDGNIVNLDDFKTKRMVCRQESMGYFIISTKHSCAIEPRSDEYIDVFLKNLLVNEEKTLETFTDFKYSIRKYKPHYISMYL